MQHVLRYVGRAAPTDDAFCAAIDATQRTTPALAYGGGVRFNADVYALTDADARSLYDAGEALMAALDELVRMVRNEPELLSSFFAMPPTWAAMCIDGADWWNLFARMDVFWMAEAGWQICEINADTPSGQTDMWALLDALGEVTPWGTIPGAGYTDQFMAWLRQVAAPVGAGEKPVLAIIYPTDIPEDLDLMAAYKSQAAAAGFHVVLGAPTNIECHADGRFSLFGQPFSLMLRHYKTDWWGERRRVWFDQPPIYDPWPLEVLAPLLRAEAEGRMTIVNPFGSMLAQSKKAFAFFWEEQTRFSPEAQATIRAVVPRTIRVTTLGVDALRQERERWVLKSDFGCEGEEVVVGRNVSDEAWNRALTLIIPERWVAQEFFEILPIANGSLPNIGLYLIAGRAAGVYTRVNQPGAITDIRAQAIPVVVQP